MKRESRRFRSKAAFAPSNGESATHMAEATSKGKGGGARPVAPHMQVWRWHVTMAASILTRATGIALYGGAIIAATWFTALMVGPEAFGLIMALLGTWGGKTVLFGLTGSVFYHLAAGLRHLVWDAGAGFQPRTANMTAVAAMAFALVASVVVWALALQTGAVR